MTGRLLLLVALASLSCKRSRPPEAHDAAPTAQRADLSGKIVGGAAFGVHLDVKRMRETAAIYSYRALAIMPPVAMVFSNLAKDCGPVEAAVDEVVASGREGWWALAARPAIAADKLLGCVRYANGATDTTFDGRPAITFDHEEQVALVVEGILYHGERTLVRELISGVDAGALRLPLGPDDVLQFRIRGTGMIRGVDASLVATGPLLTTSGTINTADEGSARDVAASLQSLAKGEAQQALDGAFALDPAKSAVRIRFSREGLSGGGLFAATAMAASSALLRLDKTGEARTTVDAIARRMAAIVSDDQTAGKPPLLPPSTGPSVRVPTAQRLHVSTGSLLASWAPFANLLPPLTFYQYEVVTTADRKHATVYARGDLDGDGALSTFEVPVEVSKSGYAIVGALVIKDSLE